MSVIEDPFESAKLSLSYARDDIAHLERFFQTFFDAKPYTEFVEHDSQTGLDAYKMKFTERLPVKCGRDTARVALELRASLDYCGYAAAKAAGSMRLKSTYFPFSKTIAELDQVIARRCKDVPPNIAALFRTFNPHKGGDDILWSLNEVANCIKHRFIQPIAFGVGAVHVRQFHVKGRIHEFQLPPKWDPVKNEVTFCVVEHGAKPDYDMNVGFVIAFGEIGALKGQAVVNVLGDMAAKVSAIVEATETEAKRSGLIS